MNIKNIIVVDDEGKEVSYKPQELILLALCENEQNPDNPFILSQMSENQSMQLTLLKAIVNYPPPKGSGLPLNGSPD